MGTKTHSPSVKPWPHRFTHTTSEFFTWVFLASLIAELVKNPSAVQETLVQFLGQEDPLEKG